GLAQDVPGSGIVPSEAGNSAERPVEFAAAAPADAALVIVTPSAALPAAVPVSDAERAAIEAAIAAGSFTGKANEVLSLRGIGSRPRLLLVGTGEEPGVNAIAEAAGKAAQELSSEKAAIAVVGLDSAQDAADAALGFHLGQYRFDRYKTGASEPPPAQQVTIVQADPQAARAAYDARGAGLAEGVRLTRDLI